jgi:hypothetical protein
MAGIDADFEQSLLEPYRAPRVAAGRSEPVLRRLVDIAIVKVAVEDVALQAFAGLPHEFGKALETQAERLGEDLLKGVAPYRIIGNIRWRDRLPRKKPAAVHRCEAFFLAVDSDLLLVLGSFRAYGTVSPVNEMVIALITPRTSRRLRGLDS